MALADLLIFDLKQLDNKKHRELTGAGNEAVLKNIQERNASGKPFWLRQVLVSDLTDDPEDLKKLGIFCNKLSGLERLEILPYHILGVSKYQKLGQVYQLPNIKPTTQKQLIAAKKILRKLIINQDIL